MSTSRTHSVGGNGGGSLKYVGDAVVAGAAATTLSISGLDLDTDGRYLVEFIGTNPTASLTSLSLFFNADTTAVNYDTQTFTVANNSLVGARVDAATCMSMAATSGTINAKIFIDKDVNGKVTAIIEARENITIAIVQRYSVLHWTTAGTNVTGFTISASVASSLGIGTTIRVWKLTT